MNYKLFITLATVALIAASCAKENLSAESQPRTITVAATMATTEDDAQTRITFTSDAASGNFGLNLKWEATDKLMLCFEHNSAYYHNTAPMVAGSMSADKKTARFTITVPSEIPADATFNLYGVYQIIDESAFNGGTFNGDSYKLENRETDCVTLEKTNNSHGNGIRPMLYFSQIGIINTAAPAINNISLTHSGWVMALHFKNSSGAEINLPETIGFHDPTFEPWAWEGVQGPVSFALPTQSFYQTSQTGNPDAGCVFVINRSTWQTLYGQKLAAGKNIIFYRWLASKPDVPELRGKMSLGNEVYKETSTMLPAKTVSNGRVYHVYTEWDGADYKLVSAY